MSVESFISCPIVGLLTLLLALRGREARERRLIVAAFFAHVVGSFAIVAYHEFAYRGGDMFLYAAHGRDLARLMRWEPMRYGGEVIKLAFHQENGLPVFITMAGTPTGTMSALMGFLMLFSGDNLYGAALLVAFLSFYGSVRLYSAVAWNLTERERVPALTGALFVPSVIFWGSGVVKEAFVLGFFGIAAAGLMNVVRRRSILAAVSTVVGVWGIGLIKPYVLVTLMLAVGGWLYSGSGRKFGFGYKLLGLGVAVAGVVAVTTFFPEFAVDKLGTAVSQQQRNYMTIAAGGSNVEIGDDDDDDADHSLTKHLVYAPLALLNALARPAFFDVHNGATLFAAIETSFVVWLVIDLVRRNGLKRLISETAKRPHYVAALWFTLPFALSVGLATRNLGTLSRYRLPMMPVFLMLLLGLRALLKERDLVKSTERPPVRLQRARVRPRGTRPRGSGVDAGAPTSARGR